MPKLYDNNLLIVGDSAGFLNILRLKGLHLAIESGILAGNSAVEAIINRDSSSRMLSLYNKLFENSISYRELYKARNFRQGFHNGMLFGLINFSIALLTSGRGIFERLKSVKDSETLIEPSKIKESFNDRFKDKLENSNELLFDKATSLFYSKTKHEEHQPPHLQINNLNDFQKNNIEKYDAPEVSFCPAEVYELYTNDDGNKKIRIYSQNCLHCKTCDIKSPSLGITWNVPYGGDGPEYSYM